MRRATLDSSGWLRQRRVLLAVQVERLAQVKLNVLGCKVSGRFVVRCAVGAICACAAGMAAAPEPLPPPRRVLGVDVGDQVRSCSPVGYASRHKRWSARRKRRIQPTAGPGVWPWPAYTGHGRAASIAARFPHRTPPGPAGASPRFEHVFGGSRQKWPQPNCGLGQLALAAGRDVGTMP
jgi:hypothetical protein